MRLLEERPARLDPIGRIYTAQELEQLPGDARYELIRGELCVMPNHSAEHGNKTMRSPHRSRYLSKSMIWVSALLQRQDLPLNRIQTRFWLPILLSSRATVWPISRPEATCCWRLTWSSKRVRLATHVQKSR